MPFFVLLLRPSFKRFELIQFSKTPENPSVEKVLEQTSKSSSNPEFKEQEHVGFYCPRTEKQILLNPQEDREQQEPPVALAPLPQSDVGDDNNSRSSQPSAVGDDNGPSSEQSGADPDSATNQETQDADLLTEKEKATSDTDAKDTNETATTSPPASSDNTKRNDMSALPSSAHDTKANNNRNDENPFDNVGPILVAIPKGYRIEAVIKMSKKILASPSFAILTVGNSIEQVENSTTEQELAQLKDKGVTKVVTKHLQNQVASSQTSSELHQEQDQDLEERRKRRQESSKSTQPGASPDAHGLSPIDAMRVAQNQQKAAARQKERATLEQYHKHSDQGGTSVAKKTGSSLSSPSHQAGEPQQLSTHPPVLDHKNPTPQERIEDSPSNNTGSPSASPTSGENSLFVPSSKARRESLEKQKDKELNEVRQRRQESRDVVGSPKATKKMYFAADGLSSSESRRASLKQKKDSELAALRGKGFAKSWSSTALTVDTDASINGADQGTKHGSSSVRSMKSNELDELREQRLANRLPESSPPVLPPAAAGTSSSKTELEELRGLGLAKALKNKFTDTALANEKQNEAHLEQLRDLEERKAKTSDFKVSRNAPLSAADEKALSVTKWKKEDRAKEQEALGYFRSRKDDDEKTQDEEHTWKTTGKVHTSYGEGEMSTKEWDAPVEEKLPATPLPSSKPAERRGSAKSSDEAKQGCACTIL